MFRILKEFSAAFFNVSGGFRYHVRALFRSSRDWLPFRTSISDEIFRFIKEGKFKSVLWIGPSGGYCVDLNVFNSVERIHILEIDPLARLILRIKFFLRRKRNVVISSKNVLCPPSNEKMAELKSLASTFDLILFSNVLGQLPFIEPMFSKGQDDLFQLFLSNLEVTLLDSNVISFHDLFSAEIAPELHWAKSFMGLQRSEIDFRKIYRNKKRLEVVDHEMWGFISNAQHRSFYVWPLSKHRYQWIELIGKLK